MVALVSDSKIRRKETKGENVLIPKLWISYPAQWFYIERHSTCCVLQHIYLEIFHKFHCKGLYSILLSYKYVLSRKLFFRTLPESIYLRTPLVEYFCISLCTINCKITFPNYCFSFSFLFFLFFSCDNIYCFWLQCEFTNVVYLPLFVKNFFSSNMITQLAKFF